MPVALVLSSQKPGESESCLSVSTLYMRFSTSKKPPQNRHSVSHILNLLLCHIKTLIQNKKNHKPRKPDSVSKPSFI